MAQIAIVIIVVIAAASASRKIFSNLHIDRSELLSGYIERQNANGPRLYRDRQKLMDNTENRNAISANHTTQQFIDHYLKMIEEVRRAKERLLIAEQELTKAEQVLAQALLPKDAEIGEKIGIWGRIQEATGKHERCFLITKLNDADQYKIEIRE